ncbi:MAG: DUF6600 domain-containing protein, partial [Gemmatimonadaceae bacterium]
MSSSAIKDALNSLTRTPPGSVVAPSSHQSAEVSEPMQNNTMSKELSRIRTTIFVSLAGVTILLGAASCRRAAQTAAGVVDPPGRVARLSDVAGTVSFEAPGSDKWVQATPNYTVSSGDRLYVAPSSHAELDFGQGVVRVGDRGDLTVTNLTDNFAQVGLADGTMDAAVYRWVPSDSIELDTPNGALIPQSAGTYRVVVDPNDDATVVNVEGGSLLVSGPGISQTLQPGQSARLTGTNPIQLSLSSGGEPSSALAAPAEFARWSGERDRRYHLAELNPAVRYVNQDMPGWTDLVDTGRWITASNQQVWCPPGVARSWVPYRSGRWTWIDPWGWTWVDDTSAGFTTTHYGRWMQVSSNSSCGMGWVPASTTVSPVYAPALVSFVEGLANVASAPDVQAWVPLGPREPYFPWYAHSDAYLRSVNVADLGNAVAIDRLLHPADMHTVAFVNRPVALTVVPTPIVVGGDPVERAVMHVPPGRFNKLQAVVAPRVTPGPRILAGGPFVARPPVVGRPRMIALGKPAAPAAMPRGRERGRGMMPTQAPVVAAAPAAPAAPFERGAPQRGMPPGLEVTLPPQRRAPVQSRAGGEVVAPITRRPIAAPPSPRPIIIRNAPPPKRPRFSPAPSAPAARGGRPSPQSAPPSRPAPAPAPAP